MKDTAGLLENNTYIAEKDNDNNLMWGLRWDHCDLSLYYEHTRINIGPILEIIDRYTDSISSCDNVYYHDNCSVCYECNIIRSNAIINIDNWYKLLVKAFSCSADRCVPKMKRNTLKYWWSQEALLHKNNALDAHQD